MKVYSIQSTDKFSYPKKTAFNGYINGHYYSDEIIKKAKAALNNPNWEKEMLANKSRFSDYLHIHDDNLASRIAAGVVSFGTTEILAAVTCLGDALTDKTDETIRKIKACIYDLTNGCKDGGEIVH